MRSAKRQPTAVLTRRIRLLGDKPAEQKARLLLPILVRQAKARQPITYQQLGEEVGCHHRVLNYPLGAVGNAIEEVSDDLGFEVPPLQAVVVNKREGVPGHGFDWFVRGDLKEGMTKASRALLCSALLAEVYDFKHWNRVLDRLGIPGQAAVPAHGDTAGGEHGGAGESDAHRRLSRKSSGPLGSDRFQDGIDRGIGLPEDDAIWPLRTE